MVRLLLAARQQHEDAAALGHGHLGDSSWRTAARTAGHAALAGFTSSKWPALSTTSTRTSSPACRAAASYARACSIGTIASRPPQTRRWLTPSGSRAIGESEAHALLPLGRRAAEQPRDRAVADGRRAPACRSVMPARATTPRRGERLAPAQGRARRQPRARREPQRELAAGGVADGDDARQVQPRVPRRRGAGDRRRGPRPRTCPASRRRRRRGAGTRGSRWRSPRPSAPPRGRARDRSPTAPPSSRRGSGRRRGAGRGGAARAARPSAAAPGRTRSWRPPAAAAARAGPSRSSPAARRQPRGSPSGASIVAAAGSPRAPLT